MAYVDTPLAAEDLDVSQPLIRGNFSQANTSFSLNHYSFSDLTAKNGKHKFVSIPVLANYAAISPAPVSGEGTLYSKTANGRSQLFYTQDNLANEIKLTTSLNPSIVSNGGYTFLPGGLIMIWGSFNPNVSTTVTFPNISFTGYVGNGFPTNCFQVQLSGAADNNSSFRNGISTGTITQTGFVWEGSVSSHWNPIYYLAIGN